jgi:eukaryotic-like serine/threonine-protein kinase
VNSFSSKEPIQFTLGPYQILRDIGKGGMGEVFLAYDTICGRKIALKRIRSDLANHTQIHRRFLKEAHITSQLTHPSIIPIYIIHGENQEVYYTMPYVEGETLKQILRETFQAEKHGEKSHSIGSSIPTLVRLFLNVCQAIAYAHSKNVLHRDLKPENIIVGKYGEVLILDWGLAKIIGEPSFSDGFPDENSEVEEERTPPSQHITRLGKVVGTVSYMAPERALGNEANFQTDIYSLGVILYQILTLRLPFRCGTLKEFRENMHKEALYDPSEVSPYRDVPKMLSEIVLKALSPSLEYRYKRVEELIHDLENYLEGRSEWFQTAELEVDRKDDWEFQENVFIAEHVAVTRGTDISDWVNLMTSKASFQGNTKIEAEVKLGQTAQGIGFLLSIPEAEERLQINDGYCLWLGSDLNQSTKLLRSSLEVMSHPELFLRRGQSYRIRIEKIDNSIHFYLNDLLQFSYISYFPIVGTHIGLITKEADYTLSGIRVFVGNLSMKVNCLAVPDAFLAHKDFTTALSEYRRIGNSFSGTAEGREALFRAGLTLIEEARQNSHPKTKEHFYDLALQEFERLHGTPGAPLEYLGKALVYQDQKNFEEEIKCFDLSYRRYPHHPLLKVLNEQVIYRMLECSRDNRMATYNFVLLALKHIPNLISNSNAMKLFGSLKKYWEPLYFLEAETNLDSKELSKNALCINLAFWLAKPYYFVEILTELVKITPFPLELICNAIFCLIELDVLDKAALQIEKISNPATTYATSLLKIAIRIRREPIEKGLQDFFAIVPKTLSKQEMRILLSAMEWAIDKNQTQHVHFAAEKLKNYEMSLDDKLKVDCCEIWAHLKELNWEKASEILHSYPMKMLTQETSLLYFLYGCWLFATKDEEIAKAHFSTLLDIQFPFTWALFSHYVMGKLDLEQGWNKKAFLWEKRALFRQLSLFYTCIRNQTQAIRYEQLALDLFQTLKE